LKKKNTTVYFINLKKKLSDCKLLNSTFRSLSETVDYTY